MIQIRWSVLGKKYLPKSGRGACHERSCIVNIPMNRVNTSIPNKFIGEYDIYELQKIFSSGKKMDIFSMDFSLVTSCHQDIMFKFIER